MRTVDIDVIGVFGPKDKAMQAFHDELVRQSELAHAFGGRNQSLLGTKKKLVTDVKNIPDLVENIILLLKKEGPSAKIHRLRLFGHGSQNLFAISPLSVTIDDIFLRGPVTRIQNDNDLSKIIQLIVTETKDPETGKVLKRERDIINAGLIEKLAAKFSTDGWVELHSCKVAGDQGKELLGELSKLLKSPILAGEGDQLPYGGLEGPIWIGRPDGTVVRKDVVRQQARSGRQSVRDAISAIGLGTARESITETPARGLEGSPGRGFGSATAGASAPSGSFLKDLARGLGGPPGRGFGSATAGASGPGGGFLRDLARGLEGPSGRGFGSATAGASGPGDGFLKDLARGLEGPSGRGLGSATAGASGPGGGFLKDLARGLESGTSRSLGSATAGASGPGGGFLKNLARGFSRG